MSRTIALDLEEVVAERRRRSEGRRFAEDAEHLASNLGEFIRAGWHVLEPGNSFVSNWHIDAICDKLEAARAGEIRRLLINIPPRHMKPESVDTIVVRDDGRRVRLGDVKVGEKIVTHRGTASRIFAVQDVGERDCVRITTHSGRQTVAALDHPMLTPDGWALAEHLEVGNTLGLVIPSTAGYCENEEARLAGYLIGDGNITGNACSFTSFGPQITSDFEVCGTALGFKFNRLTGDGRFSLTGGVRQWLRDRGMAGQSSHTKRVPEFVMMGGDEAAAQFVAAYFACDGHVNARGASRTDVAVTWTSVSFELLDGVRHLLLRLGISSRIRERVTTDNSFKPGQPFGVLTLSGSDAVARFIERVPVIGPKSERLMEWNPPRTQFDSRLLPDRIVEIEHVKAECRCLSVADHATYSGDDFAVHNSLTVSVFWPVWRWTFEPQLKFLTASHTAPLSQRDATKSRDLILSSWYQARWPHVQLKGDVNRLTRYENTSTGYRIATHVGGGTGDGGDVLILDDPHEATDATSDTRRSTAIHWHGNTFASRFNDLRTGVEVVIMQRLHEKDLSGHLIEQGGWEHLCLPARYEPKHPFVWPDDPRDEGNKAVEGIDQGDDSLLWPDRIPGPELDKLASDMTAYVAAGQLQQRPAPREGAMLKRADWRYYDPALSFYSSSRFTQDEVARLPKFDRIVHSWDTSVKDRATSDFVAGQVWGCHGANRYLLRVFHERAGLNATIEAMLELRSWTDSLWPHVPTYVIIEAAATGPDAAREIRGKVQGVVEPIPAKGPKEMRAEAAGTALEGHNCFVPGYAEADLSGYDPRTPAAVQAFIEELAVFNNGTHDDQVDAWSLMVNWSRRRPQMNMRMTVAS